MGFQQRSSEAIAAGQGALPLLCVFTSVVRPCWKSILSLLALLPQKFIFIHECIQGIINFSFLVG